MAENEYLDSSIGRRWQSVAQAIHDGLGQAEVSDRVEDRFYKSLRAIAKDLPLAKMIRAAVNDPRDLEALCKNIQGGVDAKDFLLRAAKTTSNVQSMLERFLTDSLDNCLYEIPYMAANLGGSSISESRSVVQAAARSLRPVIQRIAQRLTADPEWPIRRSSARHATSSERDRTKEMLGESLIAGFRK